MPLQFGSHDLVLEKQLLSLECAPDNGQQLIDGVRLGNVMEGTELHALDRSANIAHPGKHDDLCVQIVILDETEHFDAVDARHFHVEQNNIERGRLDAVDGRDAILRGLNVIPFLLENPA